MYQIEFFGADGILLGMLRDVRGSPAQMTEVLTEAVRMDVWFRIREVTHESSGTEEVRVLPGRPGAGRPAGTDDDVADGQAGDGD